MADDRPSDVTAHSSPGTAAWANWILKHSAPIFTTTAARDAAIPAPEAGQMCVLKTNGTDEGLYIFDSASQWRPVAWNIGWGQVGTDYAPANFAFTTAVGQSATFSPTLVDNRKYLVVVKHEIQNASATGTVDTVTLYDSTGAATAGTLRVFTPAGANGQDGVTSSCVIDSPGTGVRAYRVRAISSLSASSQTIANIIVSFIDIGPSGAPA